MDNMGRLPAVETYYNQFKFRSRIEARWATFFDCLGITYHYEPDKFQCGSARYIPDFYLPDLESYGGKGVYFEVKGPEPTDEEIAKAVTVTNQTRKLVYIFHGQSFTAGLWYSPYREHDEPGVECSFRQCPFCGAFGIGFDKQEGIEQPSDFGHLCIQVSLFAKKYDIDDCFMDFGHVPFPYSHHSPMLDIAYESAKSMRFEDPEYLLGVKGTILALQRLREGKVYCYPEIMREITTRATGYSLDAECPRYTEPWYVAHERDKKAGITPCTCYSCVARAKRTEEVNV